MKRFILLFIVSGVGLLSCRQNETCTDCEQNDLSDSTGVAEDTSEISGFINESDTSVTQAVEFRENLQKIEKKYGEQWDFCTCVIANDSVNTALMKDRISDAEFDRLDKRSGVIMQKCQAFLGLDPSRTPEERARHEARIKKCLKEAGIKK